MSSTEPTTLTRRQKLIITAVAGTLAVIAALVGGFAFQGSTPRPYVPVEVEDVAPATNTGLGRAVAAMRDLHYICSEGTPSRQGIRYLVCTGPEGRAEIEADGAGKVTYLTLVGRGDEMNDTRAAAVGRALVNGAELNQDAKIAARSITDGRADESKGPWGTATKGELPVRLLYVAADRAKVEKPAGLGPSAALAARLGKQSCRTETSATPTPSKSGSAAPTPAPTPASAPTTSCSSTGRLVGTTVSYTTAGDQVTKLSVSSTGMFAYGWTHTEAITALRSALTDLGLDATTIGDWVAANAGKQGTAAIGGLLVDVNPGTPRSETTITVTRIP